MLSNAGLVKATTLSRLLVFTAFLSAVSSLSFANSKHHNDTSNPANELTSKMETCEVPADPRNFINLVRVKTSAIRIDSYNGAMNLTFPGAREIRYSWNLSNPELAAGRTPDRDAAGSSVTLADAQEAGETFVFIDLKTGVIYRLGAAIVLFEKGIGVCSAPYDEKS